jgi:hypothetical protein
MSHFGRLAARVMRPSARQPGPALRSASPIAEHDQRLTSFDVGASVFGARDAGGHLEEGAIAAATAAEPSIAAPAGSSRPSPASREAARQAGAGSRVRPPSAGTPPGAELAGASRRSSEEEAPSNAVAALASAFARVQAWIAAPPVPPGPSRSQAAPAPPPLGPEIADAARAAAGAVSRRAARALSAPRPAAGASDSPLSMPAADAGRSAGGHPWPAPSAAPREATRLEIGQLSVQVLPPPTSPPVSRAARERPHRPNAGFAGGASRQGTLARLGFGMRHW